MSHRRAVAVVVALPLAVVLAGCGLPHDGAARPIDGRAVPYGLLGPAPTAEPPTTLERSQLPQPRTYLLGADQVLEPVPAALDLAPQATPPDVLAALFAVLAAGPTKQQRAAGLSTALGPGVVIRLVQVSDGIADLQVQASPREPAADRLPLAIGQVVLTATSVQGVDGIRLVRADGSPVEVPLPGGALTSGPLRPSDYRELLLTPTPSQSRPS